MTLLFLLPLDTLRWCILDKQCYCGTIATVLEQLGGVFGAKHVFDVCCRISLTSLKNSQENRMWYSSSMWTSGCGNWASSSAFSTSVQHLQIRRWADLLWYLPFSICRRCNDILKRIRSLTALKGSCVSLR